MLEKFAKTPTTAIATTIGLSLAASAFKLFLVPVVAIWLYIAWQTHWRGAATPMVAGVITLYGASLALYGSNALALALLPLAPILAVAVAGFALSARLNQSVLAMAGTAWLIISIAQQWLDEAYWRELLDGVMAQMEQSPDAWSGNFTALGLWPMNAEDAIPFIMPMFGAMLFLVTLAAFLWAYSAHHQVAKPLNANDESGLENPLRRLYFGRSIAILTLAVLALGFLEVRAAYGALMMLGMVMLVQGVSILHYFAKKHRWPPFLLALAYLLLVIFWPFSVAIFAIGVADNIRPLRPYVA